MSLSIELFSVKLLDPKSKGAAGRSARNVCRHNSGSAAINSFFLKRRFHWDYGGGEGGGEWGDLMEGGGGEAINVLREGGRVGRITKGLMWKNDMKKRQKKDRRRIADWMIRRFVLVSHKQARFGGSTNCLTYTTAYIWIFVSSWV